MSRACVPVGACACAHVESTSFCGHGTIGCASQKRPVIKIPIVVTRVYAGLSTHRLRREMKTNRRACYHSQGLVPNDDGQHQQ